MVSVIVRHMAKDMSEAMFEKEDREKKCPV